MRLIDRAGLLYHSDTRGSAPYRPQIDGAVLLTPEIPDHPTHSGRGAGPREKPPGAAAVARFYIDRMSPDCLNVHTVHAETEGTGKLESFTALVRGLKQAGAEFLRLDAVAASLDRESIPVCPMVRATLPGRSGWIAAQGAPIHAAA